MTTNAGRSRWLWSVPVIAIGIALGAWLLARRPGPAPQPAGQATGEMKDMPGMAGMPMPASGSGTVQLTAAQMQQFGITFATAERRPLTGEMRTTGVVAVDETRVVEIAPRFSGFVERVNADFTGRTVRRGETVAELYSPEVFSTMHELIVANRIGGGTAPRTVSIVAPITGVITDKRIVRGQSVSAGQALYTIADLSVLWVNVDVREPDAGAVKVGTGADVEVTAAPGRTLKGVVTYVQPLMRAETRTVTARIAVSNAGGQLKPGMFATVLLRTGGREALVVPNAAVVRSGDRSVVFVDMGGGELMPHEVRTGATVGDFTEILSGLGAGDRVVTSAQFLLDSESNLGEVMRSMLGQGSAAAQDMGNMPGMEPKRP